MSSVLYSLGRWVFRARKLVISLWMLVLVLGGAGAVLLNQGTDNSFAIPGTESQTALDSLSRTFPQVSGTSARLVIVAPEGQSVRDADVRKPVQDAIAALSEVDQVSAVADPFGSNISNVISDDESAAVVSVQMNGVLASITAETLTALTEEEETLREALPSGSVVSLGGELFSTSVPAVSATELVGVGVALVVLLITFGSFLAAGMPLLTAILGVGLSMASIYIATLFASISSTTPMLALMLGLAVGIDYALFIISRHQGQLRDGMAPEESTARAVATAGSAVIFAGLTVIIALLGLSVAGIPFLTTMGVAAAGAVAIAVVIALTLTPALLGFAGARLRPGYRRDRRATRAAIRHESTSAEAPAQDPSEQTAPKTTETSDERPAPHIHEAHREAPEGFFRNWVRAVTRFPLVTIVVIVGALGLASVPALDLRLALPDAGSQAEGTPARTTYDLLAEHFGEGFNGPLIVTGSIIGSTDPLSLMNDLKTEIAKLPGVAAVPLATPNQTADTGIIQVIPEGAPDSQQTKDLVQEIRSMHGYFEKKYDVDLSVTGFTAVGIDISDRLGNALLPFGILVVGLSLILLTMVFRSIWVPVKATLGFLLSVGASFGAVAAVFEWGWFSDALHIDKTGPIISFMPIILMGVLFGLAMDYEVFLVSRMREDYVHGGAARRAVETGFVGSAKVVTAAAIIMFSVFAAFVPEGDSSIKPIALGLAVGVFVDAFIVRMTLVPAVLQLLGERAWYMPKWLDRLLPSFDVEGEGLARELELAAWPAEGSAVVIAADDLTLDGPDGPLYTGVAFSVPADGTLVIHGTHRTGKTALLLTIAGRLAPSSGRLKVAGLVVPIRSSTVRSRVAVVRLSGVADPISEIRSALSSDPVVLAIDDLDNVADPLTQRGVRYELEGAIAKASAARRPLAIVTTCVNVETLTALLPTDRPTVMTTTDAAPSREEEKVS